MEFFDIFAIAVLAISTLIGIWKGFLYTVLKFGAFFLSAAVSKPLGVWISDLLCEELLSDIISAEVLLFAIELLGVVLVFVIVFLLFRILAKIFSKAFNKLFKSKKVDRLFGAAVGLCIGCGALFLAGLLIGEINAFADAFGTEHIDCGETFLFRLFL